MPEPRIEEPTDAIVRVTSSGICGSDLHMYDGHTSARPGMVLGHEPLGVVEEVGEGVSVVKEGDRVVMPFNVACGTCYNCLRGLSSACLVMTRERRRRLRIRGDGALPRWAGRAAARSPGDWGLPPAPRAARGR